jgi:hypothetical protein
VFLYAFDLIELNGDELRRDPLVVRKATLASVIAKATVGIRFNEHMELDEGEPCSTAPASSAWKASCRSGKTPTYPRRRSSARSRAAPMLLSHGLTIDHKKLPGK